MLASFLRNRSSYRQNIREEHTVVCLRKGGGRMGIFNGFDDFALILVLFVLLVIVGCDCD
ncbi:YjcZ family sporulation protein [Brevibacillus sp. NPDC003359]|uniref:YjcZ family sporulation protein n=1 Tax=unclassified Brevibacillus TaxID=2684853 RepID=UPI003679FF99